MQKPRFHLEKRSNMKYLPLQNGQQTIIDDERYPILYLKNWHYGTNGYVYGNTWDKKLKKSSYFLLHRLLLNARKNVQIDHVNGNKLDNRIKNLRLCSNQQNAFNRIKTSGVSKYKGVNWYKTDKIWYAQITVNYKKIQLGRFKNEIDAAIAYNNAAKKYYGKFAHVNQI